MSDRFVLTAYWANRPESPEACAKRACRHMGMLRSVDESFDRWFELGGSRRNARREVLPEILQLKALFERGQARRDQDRRVIEDLGYSVDLWNGAPDSESIAMSIRCGCYASDSETWLPNSCVLKLPREGTPAARLLRTPVLTTLLAGVADVWEPDWAVVISRAHRDLLGEVPPDQPLVGWLTYLAAERGPLPHFSMPVQSVSERTGSIIVSVADRFSVNDPAHVLAARLVAEELATAGLLRPTRRSKSK